MEFTRTDQLETTPITPLGARRGGAEGSTRPSAAAQRACQRGQARRDRNLAAAELHRYRPEAVRYEHDLLLFWLTNGSGSTDDVCGDLCHEFERDKAGWRGAIVRSLATAGIIRSIGFVKSRRAARLGSPIQLWQLADRPKAKERLAELGRLLVEHDRAALKKRSQGLLPLAGDAWGVAPLTMVGG